MIFRRLLLCLSLCGMVGLFSITALADTAHDRTQFGHDILIGPGQQVTEVTCFGCSVRIRGKVMTDVTTFGGNVVVEDQGEVGNDTTAFGGNVRLDKGAKVSAITVFGGRLQRDPAATVDGDITSFSGSIWLVLIFGLPAIILGALLALIVWVVRRLVRPAVPVTA